MSDTTKSADPRAERLKAALRDNLRRRKAQLRQRGKTDTTGSAGEEAAAPVASSTPDSDEPA